MIKPFQPLASACKWRIPLETGLNTRLSTLYLSVMLIARSYKSYPLTYPQDMSVKTPFLLNQRQIPPHIAEPTILPRIAQAHPRLSRSGFGSNDSW